MQFLSFLKHKPKQAHFKYNSCSSKIGDQVTGAKWPVTVAKCRLFFQATFLTQLYFFSLTTDHWDTFFLACVASVSSWGSSRKLGQKQKKNEWQPFFFCFRSNFRAITRLETLATQATFSMGIKGICEMTFQRLCYWQQDEKWSARLKVDFHCCLIFTGVRT